VQKKTLEELKRQFFISTPPPKILKGFRCEFLTCVSPVFDELPDGWTEYGVSRFAKTDIAAWCHLHSSKASYELHERLLSAANVGESLSGE
jgi:hypothetical protein